MLVLAAVAFASAGAALAAVLRARALSADVATMRERVRELSTRLEAAESDVSQALAAADVAESVLLEKGLADEEDLEAARRRFGESAPSYSRARAGEIH